MRRQKRARQLVGGLDVPVPFDLSEFCRRIEQRRGRPLRLEALPDAHGSGFCGIYVETPTQDVVFYPAGAAAVHRDHVIVHELMHLLLGHGAVGTGTRIAVDTAILLPGLDPALVSRVLGRSNYATDDEREAELTASLVMQASASPTGSTPPSRLDDLLG